jgi:predicted enzyme related to lactoylglutathione lyase
VVGMKIGAVTMDCRDPETLARFWSELTGRSAGPTGGDDEGTYWAVRDPERKGVLLLLQKVPEAKVGKSRTHIDLWVPDMDAAAARAVSLGATYVKKFDGADEGWIWMTDPEGNEFCFVQAEEKDLA